MNVGSEPLKKIMTTFLAHGSAANEIGLDQLHELIQEALDQLGERARVLAVVPDATRGSSQAGSVMAEVYRYYQRGLTDVLPALGTHRPMTNCDIAKLYPGIPPELFREHRGDFDVIPVGELTAAVVSEATGGWYQQPWPVEMNRLILAEEHDLIVVVGQVSPHELVGMSGYNQALFMGIGGKNSLDAAFRLAAFSEPDCVQGRPQTALRRVFNQAQEYFLQHLPIVFIMTVVDDSVPGGILRGLVIGDDHDAFWQACRMSQQVNRTRVSSPWERVIVDLTAENYSTVWRGNRAIQRTRLALAEGAELVILGDGLHTFGENAHRDHLIRRFGYRSRERLLELAEQDADLYAEPAVLAHLLQGSSEGRFRVTYCPGSLTRAEIESVGYHYGDVHEWRRRLPAELPQTDWINLDGEQWYYIADPSLRLWTL